MAVQGNGLGSGPDKGEFKDPTGFNARAGAAKKPQTSFDPKWGMKDQQAALKAGPSNPGSGPLAGGVAPALDGAPDRDYEGEGEPMKTSWDMKDANGKGLDNSIGGKVLGEAILSGASTLPSGESYGNAQPVRKPA